MLHMETLSQVSPHPHMWSDMNVRVSSGQMRLEGVNQS